MTVPRATPLRLIDPQKPPSVGLEPILTKAEAAAAMNVTVRFVERCVLERRIRYVKIGKFVRIPESAVREFIARGSVEVDIR